MFSFNVHNVIMFLDITGTLGNVYIFFQNVNININQALVRIDRMICYSNNK